MNNRILSIYKKLPDKCKDFISEIDFHNLALKELKSKEQLSYLYVLIKMCASHFGYSTEEMKSIIKIERFNTFDISFGDLTVFDKSELSEWIIEYAGMNGCYLPPPSEFKKNKTKIEKELNKTNKYT